MLNLRLQITIETFKDMFLGSTCIVIYYLSSNLQTSVLLVVKRVTTSHTIVLLYEFFYYNSSIPSFIHLPVHTKYVEGILKIFVNTTCIVMSLTFIDTLMQLLHTDQRYGARIRSLPGITCIEMSSNFQSDHFVLPVEIYSAHK